MASDLSDPDAFVDGVPHQTFDEHRTDDPVRWLEATPRHGIAPGEGFWSVTSHAHVSEVLRRSDVFSSYAKGIRMEEHGEASLSVERRMLIMLDPPMMNGIHGVLIAAAKLAKQVDRVTPAGKSKGRLDFWPDWTAVEGYFGSRGLFRAFDSRCLQDYLKAGLEPFNEGWRLRFRPEVEVAIFRETPTSATRMPRLRVPGAIVTGRHSPAPFLHSAQRHVRRQGMLHRIADGSHMYPLEKPDATLALFRETLDSLLAQEATV